jgi:hypothetical protein
MIGRRRIAITIVVLLTGAHAALAQTKAAAPADAEFVSPRSDRDPAEWHATVSLINLFEGNVDHSLHPVRSYGIIPAAEVGYARSSGPAFAWGYQFAANNYSGTDQWDRLSHHLFTSIGARLTARLRVETGVQANWKGSSDDRELADTFGVSQRVTYSVSESTRFVVVGGYRYKKYVEPASSGPSPYVGGKIDHRLPGDRRLTFAYRYQRRVSEAIRNRYARSAYTIVFNTPLRRVGDRLSWDFEYLPQTYARLINVGGREMLRADRRMANEIAYQQPITERTEMRWIVRIESRRSNDPAKRFFDPSFGVVTTYRFR